MIRKKIRQTSLILALVFFIVIVMTSCAVKAKKNIWGDPKTGLILTYRMPEGQAFQYQTSSEQTEKVEMMGQTMETVSKSTSKFTAQNKGLKEGNFLLGITVNDMKIDVKRGMLGNISPDMKAITGKSFELTLSPLGKEIEISGTESLQYSLGMAGNRNIKSSFRTIFPDLSDRPVKTGDNWTTKADFTEESGTLTIRIAIESVNTLQGLETINGLECVKIEAKITGTINGKGQQMGSDISIKSDIKGASTWFFAYKEGVFVKMTTETTSKGTAEVSARNMTIPLSTESKSEIDLIK